jgi:small GTP-binding protein
MDPEKKNLIKIVIIGGARSGKSSILNKYTSNEFSTDYIPTIGVEFSSKMLNVNGNNFKLQIWDTAGQERFKSITRSYYKGTKSIIIVIDLSEKESINKVDEFVSDIRNIADEGVNIYLVGTKSDLPKEVDIKEIDNKVAQYGLQYFEISALANVNLNELFEKICLDVIS